MFLELNKRSNCTPETSRDCDVAWGKTPDSVRSQIFHSLRYFSIRLQRSSCYPQHELQITSTVNSSQSTVVSTPSNPQQSADRSKPLTPQQSADCSYFLIPHQSLDVFPHFLGFPQRVADTSLLLPQRVADAPFQISPGIADTSILVDLHQSAVMLHCQSPAECGSPRLGNPH